MKNKKQPKRPNTLADNLEESFRDVGRMTTPREELLNGTIGDQILDDVLGRPHIKRGKKK